MGDVIYLSKASPKWTLLKTAFRMYVEYTKSDPRPRKSQIMRENKAFNRKDNGKISSFKDFS